MATAEVPCGGSGAHALPDSLPFAGTAWHFWVMEVRHHSKGGLMRACLACLLLLFAAACARTPPGAAALPKTVASDCQPRSFDYQDAYSNQDIRSGRVYYADFTFPDCSRAYGLGFEGEISQEAVDRLIRTYEADRSRHDIRFLVLNSPGGNVRAGLTLAHFMVDRDLAAVVGENMVCVSICSFAFITASTRIMGSGARLGIHSASDYSGRANYETNVTLASILSLVPGAESQAYLAIANATPPQEVTWLNVDQARTLGFAD